MTNPIVTLQSLPRLGPRPKKRRGQGIGSGKGSHTSGRGNKGQKARESVGLFFEGTKTKKSLIKRLPLLRGKGKFKVRHERFVAVNLKYLNLLPKNSEVTSETLIKFGIIKSGAAKILGEGDLTVPLIVKVPVSRSAAAKIVKAGGEVAQIQNPKSAILNNIKTRNSRP